MPKAAALIGGGTGVALLGGATRVGEGRASSVAVTGDGAAACAVTAGVVSLHAETAAMANADKIIIRRPDRRLYNGMASDSTHDRGELDPNRSKPDFARKRPLR